MAAGDAQRVWYPEMLAELKRQWSPGMPWGNVIAFCDRMSVMRKDIAISRDIKPPMMTCHKCGKRGRAAYPSISVRSLIFSLKKIQVISDEELKEMDLEWKRYQRKNSLTGYGKKKS
jgi:hypothetical protein